MYVHMYINMNVCLYLYMYVCLYVYLYPLSVTLPPCKAGSLQQAINTPATTATIRSLSTAFIYEFLQINIIVESKHLHIFTYVYMYYLFTYIHLWYECM